MSDMDRGNASKNPGRTPGFTQLMGFLSPVSGVVAARAANRGSGSDRTDSDPIIQTWQDWKLKQTPESTSALLNKLNPIIDKAITSYAPNSAPPVRSMAKRLAIKAAHSYDPKAGTKFQTYLLTQLQPLRREAKAYETVHIPERVQIDLTSVNEKNNQFVDENGYEPSDEELADYSGLSSRRIRKIRAYAKGQVYESAAEMMGGQLAKGPSMQRNQMAEEFVYQSLGDMDKRIYDLRTGKGGTQKTLGVSEIAKKLKVSPAAITQRLNKIVTQVDEIRGYGEK